MAVVKVRYKGLSDERHMSVRDLESVGVKVDKPFEWKASNLWSLKIDGLPDSFLTMLRQDGAFTVSEVKDDGSDGDDIITAEAVDDTGVIVVDGTTGERSAAPVDTKTGERLDKRRGAGKTKDLSDDEALAQSKRA